MLENSFDAMLHVLRYYGAIRAINTYLPELNTDEYLNDISINKELQDLFDILEQFAMTEKWFNEFADKVWDIINQ